jgi:amino acid adenylation domain-containing protein/non-ribosomal peptide synthase protein (TIGR01720 family)
MTDLQERIAALSPQQRELLERRLADRMATRGRSPGDRIAPRDRSQPTPLSIQQQREWAFGHFRGANNIIGAFRVAGQFDRDLLSRALTEVTQRHEVLRSTVEQQADGTRVQVVQPVTPVPVPVEDLTHLTDEEQRAEIRRRWEIEVMTPFDPAQVQRLRISLLRLAPTQHVVLITTDHAAGDMVSMSYLVQEFAALYVMHRSGGGTLPAVEIQYADFAVWQRETEAQRIDAEREHWRRTLEGVPTGLALPSDRPYPVAPTFAGGVHERELRPELAVQLRRFAERERASLGVVFCAACSVLLYRYTGREDLVIGEILTGRHRPEIEQIIGCFVGALPLRMQLSDGLTLREVVQQARSTVVTAYSHQDLPIDAMLDQLDLGPDTSVSSLIDMWLDVRTPPARLEVPGLQIAPEPMHSSLAPSPLQLGVNPGADNLCLEWLYMTEVFDHETVVLLAGQFERILQEIVTAPQTTVERVQLAVESGPVPQVPAGRQDTADATFVDLFQRRVALAPHAPAVVCDGVATSYAELNSDANQLARQLRACGAGPRTPVGILLDRSPLLATAVLAVLKAGGAYLPLEPAYPPDRSAGMLAGADVRVLITQQRHASVLADAGLAAPERLIVLDGPDGLTGGTAAGGAEGDLPGLTDPASLAYVVYTSGSTGRPKGVMIEHGSLARYARDVVDRLGLGSGDRFLQFASPGFDVLAEELFPVWIAGGCVVFPARPLITGGGDLTELIQRERLTVIELPTAYWHEWVRELDRLGRALPDCLRIVIIGGERVLPERLALWRQSGTALVNCYGLTETTVTSTFFRLDPADPARDWPNLPIGTPLPSADLRVLDGRLRPVPAGAAGELYIGGVSLARGYLARPALTAERFVADPTVPGQRLYRTGDLVRRRPDGNLEFLSRIDTQIKIRGYRIEPTEIESAINRHPQVAESVVASFEPAPGDRRLAGYVVARPGAQLGLADLRRFLERELPAHMVPSTFVQLEALPLSTNGKIDRSALPAPDAARPEVADDYVAPQTEVQQQLADAVSAVMGIEKVGIHDNFFEIGGDSILAIQVVARAQELGLRLSPFDVFANPTVAGLAEAASTGPAIDAEQGDISGPVPLAPSQRWLCTAGVAEPHHWNVSALLDLHAPVEPELAREAVEQLLAHHDGLRQRILVAGENTRVRIAPRGDVTPFEVHELGDLDEAGLTGRMREVSDRTQASLDLAVGPLLRVGLIRAGGQPDRLVVVAHRLAADDESMRIVLDDLSAALTQLRDGGPVQLPRKTTSWQSWARRLAVHGRSDAVQSQRAYWTDLATSPAGRLPDDHPAQPEGDTVAAARSVSVSLSSAETGELMRLPEMLSCTLPDVLLAALGRTLSSWTGNDRHVVDLLRSDREQIFDEVDLARTVGRFGHVYPVALACAADGEPDAAIRAVKEHLRAVPADGIGWQLLRQDASPVPDPPVDVAFSYLAGERCAESSSFAVSGGIGNDESPLNRRPYPVEVFVSAADGELTVRWTYSQTRHRHKTIADVARRYSDDVRAMIGLGRGTGTSTRTPSDFPLAHVDQAQLDQLLSRL